MEYAGACIPLPYQLLTMPLPFPYQLLHVQNWQQNVRGTILGLLVLAYHFLANCLPCPYHFLTNCYMRSAELTALQHVHTKQPFNARASDPEIDMPVGRAISWCLFYARRELSKSRTTATKVFGFFPYSRSMLVPPRTPLDS